MKFLSDAIDRFCVRHPKFGIPHLMRYIVVGNVLLYLLMILTPQARNFVGVFGFSLYTFLHGAFWQPLTFLFVPQTTSALGLLITCYFYFFIGKTLEEKWGTAKFTIYYLSGVLLMLLWTVTASLISGNFFFTLSGSYYLNMALFFSFATLFPDAMVLLFFFIPIRIKWLAYFDAGLFLYEILSYAMAGQWFYAVLPVVAILNYFVFFGHQLFYGTKRAAYEKSRQAEQFRRVYEQRRTQQQSSATKKCAVCGRTPESNPELQFRFCSQCAGYHCFCSDHIFSHVHFTEEM